MARLGVDRVLLALLLVSLGANLIFALASRDSTADPPNPAAYVSKTAGRSVPPLPLLRQDGTRTILEYKRPTVLYVLSPRCGWCRRNNENIRALWEQARDAYEFVGVSLMADGLDAYLEGYPLPFPVLILDDPSAPELAAYSLGATPLMYAIEPGAKIQRGWAGALSGVKLKDVEGFFDAELPGLALPLESRADTANSAVLGDNHG